MWDVFYKHHPYAEPFDHDMYSYSDDFVPSYSHRRSSRPTRVTCAFCGQSTTWKRVGNAWRLFNHDSSQHDCRATQNMNTEGFDDVV